jgi:hypothetical protein
MSRYDDKMELLIIRHAAGCPACSKTKAETEQERVAMDQLRQMWKFFSWGKRMGVYIVGVIVAGLLVNFALTYAAGVAGVRSADNETRQAYIASLKALRMDLNILIKQASTNKLTPSIPGGE